MALTANLRRGIDAIRDYLFGGGFPDPMANAEQLSYLFFFYLVEGMDADNALKARATKQPYTGIFEGQWQLKNPLNAPAKGQTEVPATRAYAWSSAIDGSDKRRIYAVLGIGAIKTPLDAVRAAIVAEQRAATKSAS